MKKRKIFFVLLLMVSAICVLSACEPDNDPWDDYRYEYNNRGHRDNNGNDNNNGNNNGDNGNNNGGNNGGNTGGDNGGNTGGNNGGNTGGNNGGQVTYKITHIWECVIKRSIMFPFPAYVMRCNNGKYYYVLRYRYPYDLHVGDEIYFTVSSFCENEIEQINGHNYNGGEGANENEYPDLGSKLVASDPIEAEVYGTFPIQMCTNIPILPQSYWCIVTTGQKLLFVTPNNIDFVPAPGDRFVYSVYTLFPNSILKAKKL